MTETRKTPLLEMAKRVRMYSELAERIRDNLFTDEERRLLTYEVGSLHVDIKEQILTHYGTHFIVGSERKGYSENDTFISFAIIKKEKADYILEQLKVLNDRLAYMMIPANFYKTTVKSYTRDQSNNGEQESSSQNTFKSDNYNYNTSRALTENRSGSMARNLAAANSEVTHGIESELYKGLKLGSFGRKLQSKKITINKDSKNSLSSIQLSDQKDEERPVEVFEGATQPVKLYAQQTLAASHANTEAYSEANSEVASLSITNGDTSTRSNFHNVGAIKGEIHAKEYISSVADLKVITMQIPALRRQFWMTFWPLFTAAPST